jgi:Chromatin remodelling complex Rsc7/Swp82 subunit
MQTERKRGRPRKTAVTPLPVRRDDGEDDDLPSDENDWDDEGEMKISQDGFLSGGREFRFQTFTLPRHPSRLYLYSLDASKLLGFRDTYNFFLRNPAVRRINGNEQDRQHLEKIGLLPSSIKNRPITLARARDIFKTFGHKVVRRGRPGKDDYRAGEQEEQEYGEESFVKMEEDDVSYSALDYTRIPQVLDGGPFRRHGISIAGFPRPEVDVEQFEPSGIFLSFNNQELCQKN